MRRSANLPIVIVALATAACTALLGDFSITGASSGGPGDGGDDGTGGEGGPGAVSITPAEAKVGVFRSLALQATGDVTWTVQEGPAGGAVDDKGLYLSPAQPGVYHVVAALKSD